MAQVNVLLFNMEGDRLRKLRTALMVAKLRGECVEKTRFSESMGALAGVSEEAARIPADVAELEGFDPESGDFTEEMMVFCNVSRAQLDSALLAMNRMGVRVGLKAILTPDNAAWSARALHYALTKERDALNRRG